MEESQGILLKSLANSGISIPPGVSSIEDLTPTMLFSICAQSLRLIDSSLLFPTSLPDSMADRFKICSDLASAVTNLGFIGDISFHKFLYPSQEDLYKLVRFLLKKLSEVPEEVKEAADTKVVMTSTLKKENDFKSTASEEWTEQADYHGVDIYTTEVTTRLNDLKLNTEMPESSNSKSQNAFDSESHKNCDIEQEVQNVSTSEVLSSQTQDFIMDDMISIQDDKESTKSLGKSEADVSVHEESAGQMDNKNVVGIEQKLSSLRKQSSEMRYQIGKLRSHEKVLTQEVHAKMLEAKNVEEEHALLKSAVQMAFDDQRSADFYIAKLNGEIDARRGHLTELEAQWVTFTSPLEERKKRLEDALFATKPKVLETLKKWKEVELELEAVLSETKKREEQHSKLSADLENQPRLAPRRSYIQRITEITKNSRKQDADIERILKETRDLQLESNSIQERLNRTYAVVDEIVFREAKKDPVGRQAYRLLVSIHENFEQISDNVLSTDRIRREVAEYEAKLSSLARRSFNVDKLQADLDAIRRENVVLEQRFHNS